MYAGKHIAIGDTDLHLRERERRRARSHRKRRHHLGQSDRKKSGIARQTPRVSITIRRTGAAKRRPGIFGISDEAAAFLRGFL